MTTLKQAHKLNTIMTQWHKFLVTQGAHIEAAPVASVAHFGDQQAELKATVHGNIVADLTHLGILRVAGDDAATFLQGQVTNDIKLLEGSISQYAGYCSPKGRLLALFLAFVHQAHIHLQLDGELVEPILKRLRMYVMRSKVSITDVSDEVVRLGLSGVNSEALLQQLFGGTPQHSHQIMTQDNITLIRLPGDIARFALYTQRDNAPALWQTLATHFTPVGKACWDYLEIQAGIPEIVAATQEAFVPQMINLDALDGINFKKGCYTGQEIVARTHYLGKVKRRTMLAHIASTSAAMPKAGDVIHTPDSQDAVGQIVRSAPAPDGGFAVLAEVRLESIEPGLNAGLKAGQVQWQQLDLNIKPLPYSLSKE